MQREEMEAKLAAALERHVVPLMFKASREEAEERARARRGNEKRRQQDRRAQRSLKQAHRYGAEVA